MIHSGERDAGNKGLRGTQPVHRQDFPQLLDAAQMRNESIILDAAYQFVQARIDFNAQQPGVRCHLTEYCLGRTPVAGACLDDKIGKLDAGGLGDAALNETRTGGD